MTTGWYQARLGFGDRVLMFPWHGEALAGFKVIQRARMNI
jgi:hypothetical protein